MYLLPSSLELAETEIQMISMMNREHVLKNIIKPMRRDFDFILIDCPPSLGLLTVNSLSAADFVYIPLQAEFLALKGMQSIINIIGMVKKQLNKALKIGGAIITLYDARKVLNRQADAEVKRNFAIHVMHIRIRDNVALAEAPIEGKTIFQYNSKCAGAEDYKNLAMQIELETRK
jgi:chromosome partitioning protein